MEDNFGTIIYIIIAIVAFVISALGKKRKKDRSNAPILGNESPAKLKTKPFLSNLEQLLKEEMGLVNEDAQNEYVDDFVDEDYDQEYKVSEEGLDQVPEETKQKDKTLYSVEYVDTSEVFTDSIQDSDLTKIEKESIIEDFNLRDAVIYSEIINRKEY